MKSVSYTVLRTSFPEINQDQPQKLTFKIVVRERLPPHSSVTVNVSFSTRSTPHIHLNVRPQF